MGMFDTVIFDCPNCGIVLEEQSKAGECLLDTYDSESVPVAIAADLEGSLVYCKKCDIEYEIAPRQDIIKHVPMDLIEHKGKN